MLDWEGEVAEREVGEVGGVVSTSPELLLIVMGNPLEFAVPDESTT